MKQEQDATKSLAAHRRAVRAASAAARRSWQRCEALYADEGLKRWAQSFTTKAERK